MTRKHGNTTEAADDPLALPGMGGLKAADLAAKTEQANAAQSPGQAPALPGDSVAIDSAGVITLQPDAMIPIKVLTAERERCAEIALMVGLRPESYAERIGADAVGAAIAQHIRSGLQPAEIAGNFDDVR